MVSTARTANFWMILFPNGFLPSLPYLSYMRRLSCTIMFIYFELDFKNFGNTNIQVVGTSTHLLSDRCLFDSIPEKSRFSNSSFFCANMRDPIHVTHNFKLCSTNHRLALITSTSKAYLYCLGPMSKSEILGPHTSYLLGPTMNTSM